MYIYIVANYNRQSCYRVCMDFDLMKFYQTYVKYAIIVNERRDVFSTAKVKVVLVYNITAISSVYIYIYSDVYYIIHSQKLYTVYYIAGYIGGNNGWRIARKREKLAIGGYKFGSYVRLPRLLWESTLYWRI